jgi:hypothetical protein
MEKQALTEPSEGSQLVERLFGPIQDDRTARILARDLGLALFVVAVLQTVVALALGRDGLVDAALFAISGVLLRATAAWPAAALALAAAGGSAALSVATLTVHAPVSGGRNILLGLVAVWISGRALVATLARRRFARAQAPMAGDTTPPSGSPS